MDDNISLNGKQGVLILIDGKKTWLSGKDLATLLKSMPASNIDQIEIMNNPPAKYEADGTAGYINIKTKKSKSEGWNGNLSAGSTIGIFTLNDKTQFVFTSQNNVNFNYRKGKINLFGSGGFSHWAGRNMATYDKTYYTASYDVNGYSFFSFNGRYSGNYFPLNLGLDYTANKKNVVSFAFNGGRSAGYQPRDRTTDLWNENHQLLKHYTSTTDPTYTFDRAAINLNWKHNIDTLGQEITFDADYVHYQDPSNDTLRTDYLNNQPIPQTTLLSTISNSSSNIFAFKTDYTKPFKGGKLEAGIKLSSVHTNLNSSYYHYLKNKWEPDLALATYFLYNENVNALYVNLNKEIKKWSLQGGLRLENMNATGNQNFIYKAKRTNTGLFPSFFASYNLNKNNTIKASVSRRINRYSFYSIMPYMQIVDSLDIWHGNPNLKPEHSTRMELGYAYKNKYFITFSYTITHDAIWYVAAQMGTKKITEFYPANIDKLNNLNLDISIPIKPANWWDINLFTNVFSNRFYKVENGTISKYYVALNENMTNTFNLGKGFKGELIVNYSTKSVDQFSEVYPRLNNFSIGLQKQVLKEKGNVVLNISDPFQWTYKYRSNSSYLRMHERDNFYFNSRSIGITFNYRFGKVNNSGRQHTTASQEEQRR
jgi:outer membrane receptor for ferrienterochelin and colicin